MNKPFLLLIFDWDGTLANSVASIIIAMQAAITEIGLEARSSETIRNIIGLGLDEAVYALFPCISKERCGLLVDSYQKIYASRSQQQIPLFGGVIDVLEQLFAQNYYLAVATGKSRAGLDQALQETGLARYFHASRCADETYSKPHPQMLTELLARFNLTASEALMIGDTEYDLQMANNASIPSIGVSCGTHQETRLRKFNPLAILPSVAELPGWLSEVQKLKG